MSAFITGSRAYGRPSRKSDVDLVVLVCPAELEILKELADSRDEDRKGEGGDSDAGPRAGGDSASLRFGRLNLLAVTDPVAYAVWQKGTRLLKRESERKPVDRDLAVKFFDMLRHTHLYSEQPTVQDARDRLKSDGGSDDDEDEPSFDYGDPVRFTRNGETVYGVITGLEGAGDNVKVTVSHRGRDWRVRLSDLTPCQWSDLDYRTPKVKPRREEADDDDDEIPY